MQALSRACRLAKEIVEKRDGRKIRGDGQSALAELIGKKQGHIGMMFQRQHVNAEDAHAIARALGNRVKVADLRPDLSLDTAALRRRRAA